MVPCVDQPSALPLHQLNSSKTISCSCLVTIMSMRISIFTAILNIYTIVLLVFIVKAMIFFILTSWSRFHPQSSVTTQFAFPFLTSTCLINIIVRSLVSDILTPPSLRHDQMLLPLEGHFFEGVRSTEQIWSYSRDVGREFKTVIFWYFQPFSLQVSWQ